MRLAPRLFYVDIPLKDDAFLAISYYLLSLFFSLHHGVVHLLNTCLFDVLFWLLYRSYRSSRSVPPPTMMMMIMMTMITKQQMM